MVTLLIALGFYIVIAILGPGVGKVGIQGG